MTAGTAQLVHRLATGWTVRSSNPGGGVVVEGAGALFSVAVQTGPVPIQPREQ
jgi:hypothetical protein